MRPGALQRKLQAIDEAVNAQRFKVALDLTDDLLRRCPEYFPAAVMRADLTITLGLDDNIALDYCLKAKTLILAQTTFIFNETYMDILNTLKLCCQHLNRWDIVTPCFEFVTQVVPRESPLFVNLMDGLFQCYVHGYSLPEQRLTASALYKRTMREDHMLWAVCSMQLQAWTSEDPDLFLKTAKALFDSRFLSKIPFEIEGSLLLCISIEEQYRCYGAAIGRLNGLIEDDLVFELEGRHMLGRLLACDKKYTEAAEVFSNLLTTCPDDWECFQCYLGCLLEEDASKWQCLTINDPIHPPKKVDRRSTHLSDEVFDSRMNIASDFVQGLILAHDKDDTIRFPHLAPLEIHRRKFLQGKTDVSTLTEALLNYFRRFGHLASCTSDVEASLQVLTMENIMVLVESFKSEVPLTGDAVLILAQKITIFKLQEFFELSLSELESNAVTMTELFIESLPLSKNLDLQENMHGIDLLSLASKALVQLFRRTQRLGYLLEAILLLEFGLTCRSCIPEFKILLVHLYSHIGAYKLAYDWYKSLGIKSLLLETASHHILPQMLSSPFLDYSSNLLEEYLSFMDHHFLESANSAISAYERCCFPAIFGNFMLNDRLQRSQKYLMARIESPILLLKQKADKIEDVECVLQRLDYGSQLQALSNDKSLESLTINDDMESRPWWSPTPDINYLLEPLQKMFIRPDLEDKNQIWLQEQPKKWPIIKRKALVPRLISLSIVSASLFVNEDAKGGKVRKGSSSTSTSDEFLALLVDYAKALGFSFNEAKRMVNRISIGKSTFEDVSCMEDFLCFAVFLNAHELGNLGLSTTWSKLDRLFRAFAEEKTITPPGVVLSSFVQLVTGPLAWQCLVLQSCTRLLVPFKKKKKKKGEPREQQLAQVVASSIESLCGTIELITTRLMELDSTLSEEHNLGRVFALLGNLSSSDALKSWDEEGVLKKVRESREATSSELLNMLKMKSSLLKKLKKQMQ